MSSVHLNFIKKERLQYLQIILNVYKTSPLPYMQKLIPVNFVILTCIKNVPSIKLNSK